MIEPRIPLPRLPAELRRLYGIKISYRGVYRRLLDGDLVELVVQDQNGRYFVPLSKTRAVAEALAPAGALTAA